MNTSGASILYPGRMTAKDRRLLKMILVIFVSFLICYLPITITKIIKPIEKYHFWNILSYLLIYLTTCINPIIYVVMSSEYRQAYWNLLMCRTKGRAKQQKELVQKQGSQRTWQSTLSTRTTTKWFYYVIQTCKQCFLKMEKGIFNSPSVILQKEDASYLDIFLIIKANSQVAFSMAASFNLVAEKTLYYMQHLSMTSQQKNIIPSQYSQRK